MKKTHFPKNRPFKSTGASAVRAGNANPGYIVLAGPFGIRTRDDEKRREEIEYCERVLDDQVRAGCPAKIHMDGDFAFVLRSEVGWRNENTERSHASGCGKIIAGR